MERHELKSKTCAGLGLRLGNMPCAAVLAVALCPIGAQASSLLGGVGSALTSKVDTVVDAVGGATETATGGAVTAEGTGGSSGSTAGASIGLGGTSAEVNVLPSGSTAPGTPGSPSTGPVSGGTPVGAIPGQPFLDINAIPVTQRRRPASRCSGAGNYDVLNGVAVLDANNTFLGVVVGAYVTGTELTRVRVSVDPGAAAGGGCVEYTTAGGRATSQGIVINTTQASLQSALAR